MCSNAILKWRAVAIAAIATQKGSQELADATLPNTIAFAEKYIGPITNPKAPTKSTNIRGKQKQDKMSMKANIISKFG